jgi:hypothetical protein
MAKKTTETDVATDVKTDGVPREKKEVLRITAPRFEVATFRIVGTSPYCHHRFSSKAAEAMKKKQEAGSQATKSRGPREAKDFKAAYEAACYRSAEGWLGHPASAFRTAMISACRLVGYKMTIAKLTIFPVPDGYDDKRKPLVRIHPDPVYDESPMRNANGSFDIRTQPVWDTGWWADVTMRWDAEHFRVADVTNLMARVGEQVGVGEGRPDSRDSAGCMWGLFRVDRVQQIA